MPTPTKGPRLGSGPAHQRLMLANLATSLFEHERITTTEAKAKRLRPFAERLITFARRGDLHARRKVLELVHDADVVHKLFAEIGPRFADRPGGYTRIVKTGPRKGDNAPMAQISLVEALTVAQQAVGEAEQARGSRFSPRRAASGRTREVAEDLKDTSPTAAAVAEEADAEEALPDTDSAGQAVATADVSEESEASEEATAEQDDRDGPNDEKSSGT